MRAKDHVSEQAVRINLRVWNHYRTPRIGLDIFPSSGGPFLALLDLSLPTARGLLLELKKAIRELEK